MSRQSSNFHPSEPFDNFPHGNFWWFLTRFSAIIVTSYILLLTINLFKDALPAIQKVGLTFLVSSDWNVRQGEYGIFSAIVTTIITSLLTVIIIFPFGLGLGLLLNGNFLMQKIKKFLIFLLEVQVSISPVIYGMWLINPMESNRISMGILPVIIVLFTITLPTFTAICLDSFRGVSDNREEGQTNTDVFQLIYRGGLGICGGIFISFSRAMGETIGITMIIGNINNLPTSLLSSGTTITSLIATRFKFTDGGPITTSPLMYAALILLLMVLLISLFGEMLIEKQREKYPLFVQREIEPLNPASDGGQIVINLLITALIIGIIFPPLLSLFIGVIKFGTKGLSWGLLTQLAPPPGLSDGGIGNGIVGSVIMLSIALLFSLPIGLLAGIFLYQAELSTEKLWQRIALFLKALTSLPSLVLGIFGYSHLISSQFLGFSAIAGAFSMGLWIILILTRTTYECVRICYPSWPIRILSVVSICLLTSLRTIGLVAPLIFTASYSNLWMKGLLEPTASIGVLIYNFAMVPFKPQQELAWAASLIVVVLIVLGNLFTNLSPRPTKMYTKW